jgi:hypothetical protein
MRTDFQKHGMLLGTCISDVLKSSAVDSAVEPDVQRSPQSLADEVEGREDSEPVYTPMNIEAHVVLARVPRK